MSKTVPLQSPDCFVLFCFVFCCSFPRSERTVLTKSVLRTYERTVYLKAAVTTVVAFPWLHCSVRDFVVTDQHSSAVVLGRLARRPVSGLTNSDTGSPATGLPQTGLCLLRVHNSATWSILPYADKHQTVCCLLLLLFVVVFVVFCCCCCCCFGGEKKKRERWGGG